MAQEASIWYRLGYALERGAGRLTSRSPEEERGPVKKSRRTGPSRRGAPTDIVERLLAAGLGAVAVRLLHRWEGRRSPGMISLLRAAASGAAAALLVELLEPLLVADESFSLDVLGDGTILDEMAGGAGAALVYAALVEPRVPGPALARGAVYGTVEYLASPWGGLGELLAPLTPQERIPFLEKVLDARGRGDDGYIQHLVFAIALAELYALSEG